MLNVLSLLNETGMYVVHSNGGESIVNELILAELQEDARFPHSRVPNQEQLHHAIARLVAEYYGCLAWFF